MPHQGITPFIAAIGSIFEKDTYQEQILIPERTAQTIMLLVRSSCPDKTILQKQRLSIGLGFTKMSLT